jgi:hypothetical protein
MNDHSGSVRLTALDSLHDEDLDKRTDENLHEKLDNSIDDQAEEAYEEDLDGHGEDFSLHSLAPQLTKAMGPESSKVPVFGLSGFGSNYVCQTHVVVIVQIGASADPSYFLAMLSGHTSDKAAKHPHNTLLSDPFRELIEFKARNSFDATG